MSWLADWTIKYNGKDNDKFIKLAKLIIPDYENRFIENDEKNLIDCIKDLDWSSADMDISKIMEYLGENDSLEVVIHGESGPYLTDEDGEYQELENEKQTYRKQNGKIIIDNEHPNDDRISDDELGLYYSIKNLNAYMKFITREIGPDNEMMPIVQSILSDVLSTYDESNKVAMELRNNFSSLETTKKYFEEMYEKQRTIKEEQENKLQGLPNFLITLSPDAISYFGGIDNLKKLIEVFGEEPSRALLSYMAPYTIEKRLKDRDIKPDELISILTATKSPLKRRDDELSKLEQEENNLIDEQQRQSESEVYK